MLCFRRAVLAFLFSWKSRSVPTILNENISVSKEKKKKGTAEKSHMMPGQFDPSHWRNPTPYNPKYSETEFHSIKKAFPFFLLE